MPSVTLQTTDASWLERLELDFSIRRLFETAVVEELRVWPEESSLRLTLSMSAPANEVLPYETLRNALRAQGFGEVVLKIRYPDAGVGLGEYLALHFEDLCGGLRRDLSLDAHWTGNLDYRLDGEDFDRVCLLAEGDLAQKTLQERHADTQLAASLAWGCGIRPRIHIERGQAKETSLSSAPSPSPSPIGSASRDLSASSGAATSPSASPSPKNASLTGPIPSKMVPSPESETVFLGRAIPQNSVKPLVG